MLVLGSALVLKITMHFWGVFGFFKRVFWNFFLHVFSKCAWMSTGHYLFRFVWVVQWLLPPVKSCTQFPWFDDLWTKKMQTDDQPVIFMLEVIPPKTQHGSSNSQKETKKTPKAFTSLKSFTFPWHSHSVGWILSPSPTLQSWSWTEDHTLFSPPRRLWYMTTCWHGCLGSQNITTYQITDILGWIRKKSIPRHSNTFWVGVWIPFHTSWEGL